MVADVCFKATSSGPDFNRNGDPPKNTTISILENKKIKEGDNVTLSCNSQGNPEVNTYKWFKDGKQTYVDLKEHGKMITLHNVSWVNETYYCSAMNGVGYGDSPQTVLPVEYSAKGVQITQETEHEGEEEVMKLVCRFSNSNPNPEKYTWYIDGTVIVNETGQNISNMRQPGSYTCVAHNEAGSSSSSPFVIAPVTETKTNEDMTVILGSVAGLIMLMLLVFLVYIYVRLRRKLEHKSTSTSNRIMETNVNRATVQDELHMDEHLYGNVQSESIYNNTSDPGYNGMQNSQDKDVDIDTLYSKINKKKEKEDINYASVQHNPKRDTKDLRQIEETEYAVVQH
ncbi:limbic system-associated membrane protein-like [Discoglossus pictus]